MKVVKSSKISPFGGINFVLNEFERLKLRELVNNELRQLPRQVQSFRIYLFFQISKASCRLTGFFNPVVMYYKDLQST